MLQNKGVLNLKLTTSADPGLPAEPASGVYVHFYDNDPGQQFTRWRHYMIAAAKLARQASGPLWHETRTPTRSVVERRLPGAPGDRTAPELFDVAWTGRYLRRCRRANR